MPTTGSASGRVPGLVSTTNEAKYRPAQSLMMVTDEGSLANGRDQRSGTSPILGSRSLPFASTLNRALVVNLIACLGSLRDRNRGFAIFVPLRLPLIEAK
jgi:hypothetical protein